MRIYWALSKRKKGYSTINKSIQLLLIAAFKDHPNVIVLPNSKDALQVKNEGRVKVAMQKSMTVVGLGKFSLTSSEKTQQSNIRLVNGHSAILSADLVASDNSLTPIRQCAAVLSALTFGCCIPLFRQNAEWCSGELQLMLSIAQENHMQR